jgi:hypothetical protein
MCHTATIRTYTPHTTMLTASGSAAAGPQPIQPIAAPARKKTGICASPIASRIHGFFSSRM